MSSLDQEFNNTLVDLQAQGVNLNKIRGGKQGQQRVAEAVAMQSANRLLTRRTLERLKSIAIGEYKPPARIPRPTRSLERIKLQRQHKAGRVRGTGRATAGEIGKSRRDGCIQGIGNPKTSKSNSKK